MWQFIKCVFGFHNWTKWQLYYPAMDWQRRRCKACQHTQLRDHPLSYRRGLWS